MHLSDWAGGTMQLFLTVPLGKRPSGAGVLCCYVLYVNNFIQVSDIVTWQLISHILLNIHMCACVYCPERPQSNKSSKRDGIISNIGTSRLIMKSGYKRQFGFPVECSRFPSNLICVSSHFLKVAGLDGVTCTSLALTGRLTNIGRNVCDKDSMRSGGWGLFLTLF